MRTTNKQTKSRQHEEDTCCLKIHHFTFLKENLVARSCDCNKH